MKKVSTKQAAINRKLAKVYKLMADTRGRYCTGCGRSDVALTHSHLISRKKRPDLQTEIENITYHCLECHDIYEHRPERRVELADYDHIRAYIEITDKEVFTLMFNAA